MEEETIENRFKIWLDNFSLFDKNDNGKIDYETFYKLLKFLNVKIQYDNMVHLIEVIDVNNDKYIDKYEFIINVQIKYSDGTNEYLMNYLLKVKLHR